MYFVHIIHFHSWKIPPWNLQDYAVSLTIRTHVLLRPYRSLFLSLRSDLTFTGGWQHSRILITPTMIKKKSYMKTGVSVGAAYFSKLLRFMTHMWHVSACLWFWSHYPFSTDRFFSNYMCVYVADCPQVQCVEQYVAIQADELNLERTEIINVVRKTNEGVSCYTLHLLEAHLTCWNAF